MKSNTEMSSSEAPAEGTFSSGLSQKPEQGSVLDRLKEIRKEFQAETTHDMDIPGYRGTLVARYAPLPWDTIRSLATKQEKGRRNPNIAVQTSADGLAHAIVGFFFRSPQGELTPVTLHGDPVVRFDTLAEALGIEDAETTREKVIAVFPDEFALVAHYSSFTDWQTERDEQDEPEIEAKAKADDAVRPTSASSREHQSSE